MAKAIDFLRLYREFQLEPGADIDDLKRAYRRRVSMVHPDRLDATDAISQQLATEHLQRLTTLYEAGVQFHRLHGRLPGASTATDVRSEPDIEVPTPRAASASTAGLRPWRWGIAALTILGMLAWGLWPVEPAKTPVAQQLQPAPLRSELGGRPKAIVSAKNGIHVGMSKQAVIQINGAPVIREGERWLYGPSWVLFKEGRVAEWYSSPLHPLRISTESGK